MFVPSLAAEEVDLEEEGEVDTLVAEVGVVGTWVAVAVVDEEVEDSGEGEEEDSGDAVVDAKYPNKSYIFC